MVQGAEPEVQDHVLVRSEEIVRLIDQRILSDVLGTITSAGLVAGPFRHFTLYLRIASSGTGAQIVQFYIEFLEPRSGRWHRYLQGLFASLVYEDTVTATEVDEAFSGDVAGRDFRVVAVGTGVSDSLKFTVSAAVEFWN